MNLNDHDFEAEQASFMTIDWLREAVKEIDSLFGKGFAKKNPSLLGDFIQSAARKYHASVLNQNNLLEHIVNSLDGIAESIDCAGTKSTEFWMQSDLAAIDKVRDLGINILPDYSMADLRYKIDCALREAL